MARHSKNNTSNSVFSYAEYRKAEQHYGTKRQRLGVDSMRNRLSCSLCLQPAREPTACAEGHLYCKECVYADLLEQKKKIKRHQAQLEVMAAEEEAEREKARLAAKERVLKDFEARQLGLSAKRRFTASASSGVEAQDNDDSESHGTKRKFDFDQEQVDKLAQEAEEAALKQIEAEQAEARRAKLPDFWLPSLTPQALPGRLKDIKLQTLCNVSIPSHTMSLKSLVPVTFTYTTSGSSSAPAQTPKDGPEAICPSCKKGLSNSVIAFLIKSCSHVVCKTCHDTLVKPSSQCVVCDKKAKDKDIVELAREGTGFAAGGRAESVKAGVSFQG